jgi:hypothetical protein
MNMRFGSIEELSGSSRTDLNKDMWETMIEQREMLEEMKQFMTCLDDFRVFFVLRDQAFISMEVKAPGLSSYVQTFCEEEED